MDAKGEIKPQMVDKTDVSKDRLTYTLTLRDGLVWHDGQPVTSEDCVASIKRWAAKDSMGQKLMTVRQGDAGRQPEGRSRSSSTSRRASCSARSASRAPTCRS
jgi:peptide/nickel transport system substrate-binding protein